MMEQVDYGTLAPLVKAVGWLVSAGAAIGFSWRGRSDWEPSEEDVSKGPAKVGGLVTTVLVGIIWSQMAVESYRNDLVRLALWLLGGTVASLLVYGFIIATMTYNKVYVTAPGATATRKVIGGFRLTEPARRVKKAKHLTTQQVFKGAAYDEDKVWVRGWRALAKLLFVVCYIGLTVSGSIALTCAAILLLLPRGVGAA
jgi:hypothetical protein